VKNIEIQARGLTFTALSDGADDAPLLMLLHGLTRTSWEWHHQIPKLARLGYRAVAPDLRGRSPGARPTDVEAYVVGEFVADVLAIADRLVGEKTPFHLMGTSIGAMIAWRLAAAHPARVKTLACINIAHPAAFAEVAATPGGEDQRRKMSYTDNSSKEGNERATFEATLERMGLPAEETDPYRAVFGSDDALRAAFHWYRAARIDPERHKAVPPVTMPTLFLWPPGAGNVSRDTARTNANHVTGPYRFEVLENAQNFALQAEPERITRLLIEHLSQYGEFSSGQRGARIPR
jgi:pimeloyl-ACP methyl ester carboxylesterase